MALFQNIEGTYLVGEDDLLCKRELMSVLGVSRSTVQRWMKKGLPYTAYRTNTGFILTDVQEWLAKEGYAPADLTKIWRSRLRKEKGDSND